MEACEPNLNDRTTQQHVSNDFLRRIFHKNDKNLRWELSVPEKCCGLSLRRGFFLLAYLKLVVNVALFLENLRFLLLMYIILGKEETFHYGIAWTAMGIDVIDIIIGVVTIVSAYKKNVLLMELYYKYSIYVFGLLSILCCFVFHLMFGLIYVLLLFIIFLILVILMQVYLNQIVKGEVLKLRSTSQFQILKDDGEPFCTYVNNDY